MKPLRTVYNKKWIPYENKVELYVSNEVISFDAPVTTVHGFFIDQGRLLLVKHITRGWEVPGGHIEEGEDFEVAMHRELAEEAQMESGKLSWLGYLKKMATGAEPADCQYPYPLSYCIFFSSRILKKYEFFGDASIVEARFFEFEEALTIPWVRAYREYFEEACRVN